MIISYIFIFFFVFLTGYLSLIKSAFISLNENKIKALIESGNERFIFVYDYLKKNKRYWAFFQIGITLSIIFGSLLTFYTFTSPLSQYLQRIFITSNENLCKGLSIFIIIIIFTYVLIVFGELIPRCIGIKYSDEIVCSSIKFVSFAGALILPFSYLITFTSDTLIKILGLNSSQLDSHITEEEIRFMVNAGKTSGSIDENEKEMINNIFEFDNISVGEISTHRKDIVAISADSTFSEIKDIINDEKFSRIPVYRENIDDIIGIFYVKDLIKYILNDEKHTTDEFFNINEIMMEPYFVPISKKTDELFEEMRKNKVHMAIVIDEYGGTAGLVTMEDLLEKIVGNIFDEYDEEEDEDIKVLSDNVFLVKGSASLGDIKEMLDISIEHEDEEDYDTLGGFLIGQLGRIPNEGEKAKINFGNYIFLIEKVEDRRIELVKIIKEN